MTEQQALSVARWLTQHLGEEYFVDVLQNLVNNGYRVAMSHVDSDWPQLIIYNAINLDDGEDEDIWR